MVIKEANLKRIIFSLLCESNTRFENGPSVVYIMPTFEDLVELVKSRPDNLRLVVSNEIYGIASGNGSTHTNIYRALRKFTNEPSGDLILVTDWTKPFEESEWGMFFNRDIYLGEMSFIEGYDELPDFLQKDLDDMRAIWNDHFASSIGRSNKRK